jgi:hypothetical protein
VARDTEHDAALLDDGTPNPDVLPALVLGVALDKPGQRPAYNGMKVLNRLQERGYKPGYLAGDRACNNSEPTEWQIPIRAMGYKPVYDYGRTNSASRPEPKARSSSRATGTARPCRNPSSTPPSTCTPSASTRRHGSG